MLRLLVIWLSGEKPSRGDLLFAALIAAGYTLAIVGVFLGGHR